MIIHTINGISGESTLLIGERLENVMAYVPEGASVLFITDNTVWQLYRNRFPTDDVIRIGTGESVKTLVTAELLYQELLNRGADRSTFIVGVGGGIVCDIVGFVSSTYMRGLRFGFVSTTLLAQVDASVGGKNGVNFKGYKNMVGVFNQPDFVICDIDLLKTLPNREVLSGFSEMIKTAVIADETLFDYMEKSVDRAVELDRAVLEKLVSASVLIKSRVVNQDEKESGERRKLNFGHTLGHAVEKTTGMLHGEAVSIGMAVALTVSSQHEGLPEKSAGRIIALLRRFDLPVQVNGDLNPVLVAMEKDKKKTGSDIYFVFLKEIGQAVVRKIPMDKLIPLIRHAMTTPV